MRLILINSFGPMASSVIASICEKFGYLNLPIRKRNFHEYITKKRSLSDPYFKKETIRIFKSFEKKKNIGGINIFARDKGNNLPRINTEKKLEKIYNFEKKEFKTFSEMYFESMMIFNECLIYKDIINNPKGVVELSINLHKYNSEELYNGYKNEFEDIKIINLTRDFDDLINSMVSQNFAQRKKELHHYTFNIVNYKKAYKDYLDSIEKFEGLKIDFKNVFLPNTENLIQKISDHIGEDSVNYQNFRKQKFDLYGKVTEFQNAFTVIDSNINYIFPVVKKLLKIFFFVPEKKITNILMIIIFQIFYLFSMMKFKIKYKKIL